MWFFDLGIVTFDGNIRKDCKCEAMHERMEPFFALAAKPVRSFEAELFGAKMDV